MMSMMDFYLEPHLFASKIKMNRRYGNIKFITDLNLQFFPFKYNSFKSLITIIQVLLVSSHSKPGRWIIPGGKIQANEDAGTSAAREAMEEAGARGRLGRSLGTFADPDRKHRTTVFVLHVDPENGGLVGDFEEKVCYNV